MANTRASQSQIVQATAYGRSVLIGGIVIIAAAITLASMIPLLVARQTAITQTREGDRYSSRLRLLDTREEPVPDTCRSASTPLLAQPRALPVGNGDDMDQGSAQRPRLRVNHRTNVNVREIAKLRARRAARLSSEAAAGRRRLVISASLAVATLVVALIAASTSLSWYWLALPGTLFIASMVASRVAAIHSRKMNEAEIQLLNELKGVPQRSASTVGHDASETVTAPASAPEPMSTSEPAAPLAAVVPEAATEPLVAESEPVAEDEDLLPDTASVERKTWSVAHIPAPSYAMRGRVSGRAVHADTDLRGIPKVAARVPARPFEASAPLAGYMSTDEVVDHDIALDLNAVLEARRAQ